MLVVRNFMDSCSAGLHCRELEDAVNVTWRRRDIWQAGFFLRNKRKSIFHVRCNTLDYHMESVVCNEEKE